MGERLDDFGTDTDIVLVTFTDPTNLADYSAEHGVTLPIMVDGDRSAYRAFGLGRGSAENVWGPATLRRYAQIIRGGGWNGVRYLRSVRNADEDLRQLGGNFVVDPDGRLAWGYWGSGPADRPTVDQLVEAARAATPTAPD